VNEADWLSSDDPDRMLQELRGRITDRQLRLFACACCRHLGSLLAQESLAAVVVIERYEDGMATWQELHDALASADEVEAGTTGPTRLAARAAAMAWSVTEHARSAAAHAAGNSDAVRRRQAEILRDIVGNPFHPAPVDLAWLRWHGACVEELARALYQERRHADLPILADALEDAGCQHEVVLSHCRAGGDHVHGCWVLDALLGAPIVPDDHLSDLRTITIEQAVERQVRYIRQTSCPGHFAVVTLRVEPYPGPAPVVFVNAALARPLWGAAVEQGVRRFVREQAEASNRITGVRVLVTRLEDHPVDSRQRDFETAAALALAAALGLEVETGSQASRSHGPATDSGSTP
jgi:hypothetical protein